MTTAIRNATAVATNTLSSTPGCAVSAEFNAHKKHLCCSKRKGRMIDFWVAFSELVIIGRRVLREAWSRYRW
jgi:hypothetical protein